VRGDSDGRSDRRTVEAHHPDLKDQPRRFNELRRLVPGITQRMLTLQLRALEQDGVVARTVHNSVPPHVEYSFTRKGLTLGPILDAMEAWGKANRQSRRRT
jgi:DNA-binding HxlR family transcriptional regulator